MHACMHAGPMMQFWLTVMMRVAGPLSMTPLPLPLPTPLLPLLFLLFSLLLPFLLLLLLCSLLCLLLLKFFHPLLLLLLSLLPLLPFLGLGCLPLCLPLWLLWNHSSHPILYSWWMGMRALAP